MPNACLYLHELIDIVGTGSEAYKDHTGRLGTGRSDGGAPLVGTWQQSGSTGTWPVVVNLWEMRGWDHWSEILERQYTRASGQEPTLRKWWAEATRYRSGGFDRILEPAPFSRVRSDEWGARRAAAGDATVKPGPPTVPDAPRRAGSPRHAAPTYGPGARRCAILRRGAVEPADLALTDHLGTLHPRPRGPRARQGASGVDTASRWCRAWCVMHPD
jgi:hypothetical protein